MLTVLIVDDHAIIRKGLSQILLEEYHSATIHEASNAEDVYRMLLNTNYDIILCDLSMPGRSGLDLVEYARFNNIKTPILIISIHPEEQYAIRALKAGAAGYLSKDTATEELIKAVQRVLQGRKYISPALAESIASQLDSDASSQPHELLSNREMHVLKLIVSGKSLTEIAEQLALSVTTVSTYRARITSKMKLKTNAELTRYCLEHKLLTLLTICQFAQAFA